MIAFAPIAPIARAQTVDEKWADSHGPVSSATAHDYSVGIFQRSDYTFTAGTSVRSGGSSEFVVLWHWGPGDPPNPDPVDEASWPPSPRDASAVAAARAEDVDYTLASLICVAGNEIRSGTFTNGFSQVLITAFGHRDSTFEAKWEFTYADDTPHIRHHTAVAIDAVRKVGALPDTRIAVLVRSHSYSYLDIHNNEIFVPDRYSVIVLEREGDGDPYNHIETFDVSYLVTSNPVIDMKMDEEHIWILSQDFAVSNQIPVTLRGYSHDDYSEPEVTSSTVISDHALFPVRLRHVEGTDAVSQETLRIKSELVAIASVLDLSDPTGPRDILTLRWGMDGSTWDRLWTQTFDGGGHDIPADVAAVRTFNITSFQSSSSFVEEAVFVVGSSENTGNDTFDFTTILYKWDPLTPVDEIWVARYDPHAEDDHALAVQATYQKNVQSNEELFVAVVTGVRMNEYDEWDWLTVKYDESVPSGFPPDDKEPIWDILYPQNSSNSEADDFPVALTIKKVSGTIRAWVTGTFARSASGDDLEIVHYEEVND